MTSEGTTLSKKVRERKKENLPYLLEEAEEAAAFLRKRMKGFLPEIAVILGTGLGRLASNIKSSIEVPYEEIPHFASSTVKSHAGELHFGTLAGKKLVAMEGRFHVYEGFSLKQVTFPVRAMRAMGAKILIVSNASGGMNPQFEKGDLALITDHINFMGLNPLIGPNHEKLGPRFPDMSAPYSRRLIHLAEKVAREEKISAKKGVYIAVTGPNLETAAEYRMMRLWGADMVGMSTVPEVIVAVHSGMEVLGVSVITDLCFPDELKPVDIDEIIATAETAGPKLDRLIEKVIEQI